MPKPTTSATDRSGIGPEPLGWRFLLLGRPAAPWRATLEQAQGDAADHDCARRYACDNFRVSIIVPGDIQTAIGPVETEWRRPIAPREKGPSSPEPATGIERIIARREAQETAGF